MSMLATVAFVLSFTRFYQRIFRRELRWAERLLMIALFGLISIIFNYTGVPVHGAVPNSRAIGAMAAGFLGGPLVGAGAGLVAGVHRYFLGGFTALPCGLATFLEGLAAGIIQKCSRTWPVSWPAALAATAAGEAFHMLLTLLVARPFSQAWALVQVVGPPMITINAVGVAIFVAIVKRALDQEQQTAACQAQKALQIATQTLPFLRQGLNRSSAAKTAEIIYRMAGMDAVAITDEKEILVHLGEGADHHVPGSAPLTEATRQALVTGTVQVANSREEIGCRYPGCKLTAAVVVPLKSQEAIAGTLKLYRKGKGGISALDLQLALGLADLFSTQLELARLEQQARLAAGAELRALQAQINPHFLFNALNTITSLVRTRPDTARALLVELSNFFRCNLQKANQFVTLSEELAHVDSYLAIEQARFGEKLRVLKKVEPAALFCLLPSFTLQPIVENAVKHGLHSKEEGGQVEISAAVSSGELVIEVRDDGVGIPKEEQERIFVAGYGRGGGAGIGLSNVNERLKNIYGPHCALRLKSQPGQGTVVAICIPAKEDVDSDARKLAV
jgi:two-component system sensor histidine kinase LytS